MSRAILIVGAGPAGVSAALWARSRDLEPLVLEAGLEPGGQLHDIHFQPLDLPGPRAATGPELAAAYAAQLRDAAIEGSTGRTTSPAAHTRGRDVR